MLKEISEERVKSQLINFSCARNEDVESFLKNTAIRFEYADKSRTYLIIPKDNSKDKNGNLKILGYFATSVKHIKIPNKLSKNKVKKLDGINKNANELNCYLIGQLAKNDEYKKLIDGKEILNNALNVIKKCYELVGIRVVLVECINDKKLIGQDEKTGLLQFITTIIDENNSKSEEHVLKEAE